MGLLGSLSNQFYQDCTANIGSSVEASKKLNSKGLGSRTNIGLMDLVYSFTETRMKFDRGYISTFSVPSERSKLNCKEIINHYNTMTTLPLARSYLVGGFVGSKSQLWRRRKNNVGRMNLWDIIRDLLHLVGNSPVNHSQKHSSQISASIEKDSQIMQESSKFEESTRTKLNSVCMTDQVEEPSMLPKQSYADVAKRCMKDHLPVKIRQCEDQSSCISSESCDRPSPKSVIEPISPCNNTESTSRPRIASECSADSEDSFIVFECCEDENVDKDIYSSDDETLSCLDEASQSDSGIVSSSNSSFCNKKSPKKVRFAEEKSLVKVHPMVTWDYAYRMARKGPWEMLARDSERFKLRIAKTEAVLKPILDPQHRSVVYRDRFSDPLH